MVQVEIALTVGEERHSATMNLERKLDLESLDLLLEAFVYRVKKELKNETVVAKQTSSSSPRRS